MLKKYTEMYALGKHISMSANKTRRVIDQIRGRSYDETLLILELMPYRACFPIFKLVYSAAANANYTMGSKEVNLIISKAKVHEGTTRKKFKPRVRGRSSLIKRSTCHLTTIMKDISLDDKGAEINSFKKPRGKKVVEEYGRKNKSTWFQTWYNPKSSFSLVCTSKKLF